MTKIIVHNHLPKRGKTVDGLHRTLARRGVRDNISEFMRLLPTNTQEQVRRLGDPSKMSMEDLPPRIQEMIRRSTRATT
jgi:hypothetical protein